MFKKKSAIALGLLSIVGTTMLTGCSAQNTAQTQKTVALVDHQLVVESHPEMKAAQKAMQDEYDKIQNELKDMNSLSSEEQQAKVMEFQKKLSMMEHDKLVPIQKAADEAVEATMKDKKMEVVLDKRVAVAGGEDITKEVLVKEGLSEADADAAIQKAKEAAEKHIR